MKEKDKTQSMYRVKGVERSKGSYSTSTCLNVVAESVECCIEKVRDIYPDIVFVSINHEGVLHIL